MAPRSQSPKLKGKHAVPQEPSTAALTKPRYGTHYTKSVGTDVAVQFQGLYQGSLVAITVTDAFGRTYDINPAKIPSEISEYKDLLHADVKIQVLDKQLTETCDVVPLVVPGELVYDNRHGNVFSISYVLCADDTWRCVPVLVSVTPVFLLKHGIAIISDFKSGLTVTQTQNSELAKAQRSLATKLAGLERKSRQEVYHAECVAQDHETLANFYKARADLHERRADLLEAVLKQYADEGSWTVTDDGKSVLNVTEPGFELAKAAMANPISVAARA